MIRFPSLALAALTALSLAACGGTAAPAASSRAAGASGSAAASAAASAGGLLKPEKPHITVGRSAPAGTFIPFLIAHEAGYFTNHGLDVDLQQLSPPLANQGLVSGSLDIYEGATSVVTAVLGGPTCCMSPRRSIGIPKSSSASRG